MSAPLSMRASDPAAASNALDAPASRGAEPMGANPGAAQHKRQARAAEYRARAADQGRLAEGATLVQVRDKHLEAAATWRLLAEGEEQRGLEVRAPGARAQRRPAGPAQEAAPCTA